MEHYGDITKIKGDNVPIVDIITGGSPCQDLSVAGKRAGLDGERSGLFMEQIRLIKEMRENDRRNGRTDVSIRPRYMVWENVPGAFSSNKGEDFRIVLEETAKIADENAVIPRLEGGQKWTHAGCIMGDGYSIAWRMHDAQWFGVPQRRKRICLVADFNGDTAPRILFELQRKAVDGETDISLTDIREKPGHEIQSVSKSLSGNTEPSKEERQGAAEALGRSIGKSSKGGTICIGNGQLHDALQPDVEKCKTLNCLVDPMKIIAYKADDTVGNDKAFAIVGDHENRPTDMTNIVVATDSDHIPCVAYGFDPTASRDVGALFLKEKAKTCTVGTCPSHRNGVVTYGADIYNTQIIEETASTVTTCAGQSTASGSKVLTYGLDRASFNQGKNAQFDFAVDEEQIGAMTARGPGAVFNSVVRRLTPLECERLQGFPDGWTDIGDWIDSKGKTHKGDADSPRYKALGNSIALPFWQWLADRMVKYIDHKPTMASLFDGIGGFPLVYSRAGCEPLWASEIEEFPIAVTKLRFKEKTL